MQSLGISNVSCSSCFCTDSKFIYCTGQELFSGVVCHGWPVCKKDACVENAKKWCENYNTTIAKRLCDGYIPVPISQNIISYPDPDGKMRRGRLSGLIIVVGKKVYVEVWEGEEFPELSDCPCIELHQGMITYTPFRKWVDTKLLVKHNPNVLMMFHPKTNVQTEMIQTMINLLSE